MKNGMSNEHLSAERLQAFLEGELPTREHAPIEEHLTGCARCSAELDAWRVLLEDLDDLSAHRPHEGFADRVIAGVGMPEPLPLAARIRARLEAVGRSPATAHVGEAVLQDFLDGQLAARQSAQIERHLAQCAPCTAEADAWFTVQRRLEELETFSPAGGLTDRVMAGVHVPERVPLAARVRAGLAALVGTNPTGHLGADALQDFVDGMLPARQMARVETHLVGCESCSSETREWRGLRTRLEALEPLAPQGGFGDRVMASVRIPAPRRTVVNAPAWARTLAIGRRFVPHTRQAWAALSGVAVTPAATVALVFYAVFSHPTLTLGSLASFAWWQVTDLAAWGWTALSSAALESTQLFGVYSLVETLSSAPLTVAGGVLVYSMASVLALRVLYRNLTDNRPLKGRYAHVTAS